MTIPTDYNVKVFYIADEDQRDQCQFIYTPLDGEPVEKRCQRDGIYRIGLTIFLCGYHMPGVGRYPVSKPVEIKKPKPIRKPMKYNNLGSMEVRLMEYFSANFGETVSYQDIETILPELIDRQSLFVYVSRIRKIKKVNIINVHGIGYRYLGYAE